MENVELLPGIHTELLGEQELHLNMCVCWATDTLRFICYSSKHFLTNTKALTLLPNLWVAFSSSAKWSEEYIHHKAAIRLDYMSHSVMDRVYHVPQGHGHMWTHQIHRAPGSFKLAATVTVSYIFVPSAANLVSAYFGFEATYPISFIYRRKQMSTVFITFRFCYIQSNGWAGFLYLFCTEIQCPSRWHSTPFWPHA